MAVLSNREILTAIKTGRLKITPEPKDTVECLESDAINLTLAPQLQVVKEGVCFDPVRERITDVLRDNVVEYVLDEDRPFVLKPGECVLAMTAERITLPPAPEGEAALMALIEGRSTLGRAFVTVHVTAPFVHNGTDHRITLEIVNLGKWHVLLRKGMNIAQMTFFELGEHPRVRLSQFHQQQEPSGARKSVA